jgi:hypothetical protein
MTKRSSSRFAAAVVLSALVGATEALAGSITINMTTSVAYRDDSVAVDLQVSNSGDEAARSVVPILRFRDKEVRGTRRDALAPGEKLQAALAAAAPDLGTGRFPFRVAVDYTDANQYPFQALHVGLLTMGDPSPAKLAITDISVGELSRSATVRMKVKNLAGVPRRASVTLFAPDDLEASEPTQNVELAAWGEAPVRVDLVNRTALAGSRYPLFVAAEYDDEQTHQTVIAQGLVSIISPRAFISTWLWWVVGGLLAGWIVLLVVRGLARRE